MNHQLLKGTGSSSMSTKCIIIAAIGLAVEANASTSLQYNESKHDGSALASVSPVFNFKVFVPAIHSMQKYWIFHFLHYAMKIGLESGLFEDVVPNWRDFKVAIDELDCSVPTADETGKFTWCTVQSANALVPDMLQYNILKNDERICKIDGNFVSGQSAVAVFAVLEDNEAGPLASAANVFGTVFLSGFDGTSQLADKRYYPLFVRTAPQMTQELQGLARVCVDLGWKHISALQSPSKQELGKFFTSYFYEIAPNSKVSHVSFVEATADSQILAQWDEAEAIATVNALLRTGSRITVYFQYGGPQRYLLFSHYLNEYGLLGPEYVWLFLGTNENHWISSWHHDELVGNLKKIEPTNPFWQTDYNWDGLVHKYLGIIFLKPSPLGSRFFGEGWKKLWTGISRDELQQAGSKHMLNDSHYDLKASVLREQSWKNHATYMLREDIWSNYPMMADSFLCLFVAIGKLLEAGTAPAEIKGHVLYEAIQNSPFEGVSGFVNLTDGERLMKWNVYQMQPKWSEIFGTNTSAVHVGIFDSAHDSFVVTGKLRFADGSSVPPRDKRLPCEAGSKYDESARQCIPCTSGRYSPEPGSKCFECQPGRHSSENSNACKECAFGQTFDSEVEGGSCRMDINLIVALACVGFLGLVCVTMYQRRARIFHWIRFRRIRAHIPGIVSDEYLCTWKMQGAELSMLVPPQEYAEVKKIREVFDVYQAQLSFAGKWSPPEAKTVLNVVEVLLGFFVRFMEAVMQEQAKFQSLMRNSYQRKRQKYWGVYNSVLRGVILEDDDWSSYPPLILELQKLVTGQVGAANVGSSESPGVAGKDTVEYAQKILAAHNGLQPALTEDRHSLIDLMQHSLGSQAWLAMLCHDICHEITCTSTAKVFGAKQKGMYRCIEKFALERAGRAAPVNRCRDAAREMIMCKDVCTICSVLRSFIQRMVAGKLLIVSFKDRFQHPTDGGWSDCLLSIVRVGDPVFHIAEVQIVHEDMMAVRRNMGAHHEYNEFRAIAEIFVGLNWALSSTNSADTAMITQHPTDNDTLVQSFQETIAKQTHQLEDQAKQLAKYRQHERNAIAIQELDDADDHHDESASLAAPPKPKVQEKIPYHTQVAIEP
eukprot:gnl/MRDRNA2_/MRDRNA2_72919_c0_seq1.p1 gnl/MRDRNA2_/MRDRNA2_72919_c0~~gnl/MRDRNA2_/MRDRNA2_72919_c0_seq1.p1  ORF type:complete len:1107 (-),score=193.57 gnl/MRDRNA2_/MRDRNA2_72919_c0_seq1:416-3736(-)